jgi:putative protease
LRDEKGVIKVAEQLIGRISHYYTHLGVGIVEVADGEVRVGDVLHFKGHTSDFQQKITSMQYEHKNIEVAKPGESVGIKTDQHVRENDEVFKVTP